MNFLNALKELSGCNRNSNRTGYGTRSHAAYYIVRNVNVFSNIIFALMVASAIIPVPGNH